MTKAKLFYRNLTHYWRTNLAVIAGVAAAVAVLAGALLVGDSVRASLGDLVLLRLGETSFVITSENFFREELADELTLETGLSEFFRRGGSADSARRRRLARDQRAAGLGRAGLRRGRPFLAVSRTEGAVAREPGSSAEPQPRYRVRCGDGGFALGSGQKTLRCARGLAAQRQGFFRRHAALECRRNS